MITIFGFFDGMDGALWAELGILHGIRLPSSPRCVDAFIF